MTELSEAMLECEAHFAEIGLDSAAVGSIVYDAVSERNVVYCGIVPSKEHLLEVLIQEQDSPGPICLCSRRPFADIGRAVSP